MNRRFVGMIVAVLVSYTSALVPFDAIGLSGFAPLALGMVGAPVAALLGWWLTPHVLARTWAHALVMGLGTGALAAVLGVLEVVYVGAVARLATESEPLTGLLGWVLVVGTLGLAYSVLAMPITIPSALAWVVLVRVLLSRLAVPGRADVALDGRHIAIVLVVIALGAALVPRAVGAAP